MDNKKKTCEKAIIALKIAYPSPVCSLDYKADYQLLIATRLAAQCTDKRVNSVTKILFRKFPNLESLALAKSEDIEKVIRPCGFYKIKSKDIVDMCRMLVRNFNSVVPNSMEDLLKLPGVGRKTANLILGDVYKKPAIVVDTHCIRITHRLGLHSSKNPTLIEKILKPLLPAEESNDFCHRLVMHGRAVCKALHPECDTCCMSKFCSKNF